MLLNIPTEADYRVDGINSLNFAWDIATSLFIDLEQSEESLGNDHVAPLVPEYWQKAERRLQSTIPMIQQGVEFLLKGKVAAISPYLLLSGQPSNWPRGSDLRDTEFADFRSIDAQDLIRTIDTFGAQRFDEAFVRKFEALRKQRNKLVHTANAQLKIDIGEVLELVLYFHKALCPNESWASQRLEFLANRPVAALWEALEADGERPGWINEMMAAMRILSRRDVETYFSIPQKTRRYICPGCQHACGDHDFSPETAFFALQMKGATFLHCVLCDEEHEVVRLDCEKPDCKGNALSVEYEICCSCGADASKVLRSAQKKKKAAAKAR